MKLQSTYKNQKYCVDIPGAKNTENLQTIVYPCHNGPNQKFRYNRRTKTLRNKATKKCLTAYKGRIVQKRCGKNKNTEIREARKEMGKSSVKK